MPKCAVVRDERCRTALIPHGADPASDVSGRRAPELVRGPRCRALLLGTLWQGALLASMGGESRAQTGPYAYLPSTVSNTLSVIDIPTNTVVTIIQTGARGFHPVVSGDQSVVYVSNYLDNTVTPIDTATNTPGAPIAVGTNPYGLAITPNGTTVYVANGSGTTVSVISTATNTVTATIGGFSAPTGVIVTPNGTTAYVTNQTGDSVTPIDVATNTAGPPILLAPGSNPFFLTVTPNGATIYVANSANGTVTPINTATNTAGAPVPIGSVPTYAIATPDGQFIYVANQTDVVVLRTSDNSIVTTIPVASFGLGVSPDGTTVYVITNGGTTLTPIDTATNTAGTPIMVGGSQFPGICSNGNALLATGLIFKANVSGALACTMASGPTGSAGPVFTGGTMKFAGANISSALPIALMAAGGIFDTAGNNATLSGAIDGAGGLTKVGLGTLTLIGAGTYAGPTAVNAGTLQAGAANAFSPLSAYSIATGTILNLDGFNQTIGSLTGSGNVTLGSATLTTGNDGTNTTFSGGISGAGGLTKSGSGTFALSGINAYTGATNVNGGTLTIVAGGSIVSDTTVNNGGRFLVNGASAGVTVNAGGLLGGTGTVGNAIINGGTLSPGNSIGTIAVAGSLVMSTAASYLVEVSPMAADRTSATGAAAVAGTVNAAFAAGNYMARSYTILSANDGRTGTFGALATTNLPSGFSASLSYTATEVLLNLTAALGQGMAGGLPGNQQSVASGLNVFFNNRGGLPPGFVTVFGLTGDNLRSALTQLSGEAATGSQRVTFNAMGLFMGLLTDPFVAGRGDGATGGSAAGAFAAEGDGASAYAANGNTRSRSERDAYAAMHRKAPPIAEALAQRWSVWAAGYGGSQTTDGNAAGGSNTATSRVYGTAVGADYRFSPYTIAGFALAGGGTNFSVANSGSGRSDLFQAGAFIRHTVGPVYLSAALAYGWQDVTTDRTVAIAGIDQLRAKFNANAWSGRVESGYRFVTQDIGFTPYAAGQFTAFELPNYAEGVVSGANTFALAYAAKSVTATRSELGLRTDKSFAMQDSIFTLRGRVAWAHDFNPDRSIAATFQTLPGASFVVNGAAQAGDAALTTASAEMKWRNGWSVVATAEGELSNVTRSYAGKGAVRYAW
jgi:autotransporter-associated beta strand protein/YVTN family beta-propeller protein